MVRSRSPDRLGSVVPGTLCSLVGFLRGCALILAVQIQLLSRVEWPAAEPMLFFLTKLIQRYLPSSVRAVTVQWVYCVHTVNKYVGQS